MPIRIAIFEDHQSIIDGYLYRLNQNPEMEVVGFALYGIDLEPMLANQTVDVLLLDIHLPTSSKERTPFPILQTIPRICKLFPNLRILVISMSTQITLIQALVQAGVHGYIFKDDQESIQKLSAIVAMIANGGMYFSNGAQQLIRNDSADLPTLTQRQIEILSLCAKWPDMTTAQIAARLNIADSTVRNALAQAYRRLDVHTRAAALARLQQLGVITSPS
jgi:DNA-binding NarL/FixJ family response regulator